LSQSTMGRHLPCQRRIRGLRSSKRKIKSCKTSSEKN